MHDIDYSYAHDLSLCTIIIIIIIIIQIEIVFFFWRKSPTKPIWPVMFALHYYYHRNDNVFRTGLSPVEYIDAQQDSPPCRKRKNTYPCKKKSEPANPCVGFLASLSIIKETPTCTYHRHTDRQTVHIQTVHIHIHTRKKIYKKRVYNDSYLLTFCLLLLLFFFFFLILL
jgi:hypothetical protein